jgi:carboxylesterase type B
VSRFPMPSSSFQHLLTEIFDSLGLYGWASSPYEPTMDANVGAHDGMASVQWTKEYISNFGGDPKKMTVVGHSAGSAIINSFLTAYGGKGELPFSQVRIAATLSGGFGK